MAKLRSVSTAIWSDPFIEDCTPQEKLIFIYLITNEKTNMLGVYEVSDRKISFETGIDIETISKALKRFETLSKVKRVGNYVVLSNFLKNQSFNGNMMKSAIDVYNSLPKELKFNDLHISRENYKKAFETLCKGFGMVRKIEDEDEDEDEDEIESESTDLSPFELIQKEKPSELEAWKMQNLKSVHDFNSLVDSFNDSALLEIMSESNLLKLQSDMLIIRFRKYARSWIANQKGGKVLQIETPHDPDYIYFTTNTNKTPNRCHRDKWESYKANEEQGGRILTVVEQP